MSNSITGECIADEETYSDSEEDNKNRIKYLKLDWQSADFEEVIERINSRQNIKTYQKHKWKALIKKDTS